MAEYANKTLLKTKLYRPEIPEDFVCRDRLHGVLDQSCRLPITIVSAPAGYGKSTLVSHWLEHCDLPVAWLSLDEKDNDLIFFLQYLLASVHSVYPGSCLKTEALSNSMELLSVENAATCFINELDQIKSPFILCLDDYHLIQDTSVHELMSHILRRTPRSAHWCLITRQDPPIPVNSLCAEGKLTEIRQSDLKFSKEETVQFFDKVLNNNTEGIEISCLHEHTEGWAAGLRLASIALANQDNKGDFIKSLNSGIASIEDYLLAEVLSIHSQEIQDCVLNLSIVNRFCGALCESICDCNIKGEDFIRKIQLENLFCISLDNQSNWYRFHHLFQEMLKRLLEKRHGRDYVQSLHRQASVWFEQQGFFDESLQHMLDAGNPQEAASFICRHRLTMMNEEQWHRLNYWLGLLPKEIVETNPELLILKAWIYDNRSRRLEAYQLLDPFELLLKDTPIDEVSRERLIGEMDVLRSMQYYDEGDGQCALTHANNALHRLPTDYGGCRGYAVMLKAASLQMVGDLKGAHKYVFEAMKQIPEAKKTNKSRLLFPLCFVNWVEGDLHALERSSKALLDIGRDNQLSETFNFGSYFNGIVKYYQNQIEDAGRLIAPAISDPVIPNMNNHIRMTFLQCLVYLANWRVDDANELIEMMTNQLLKSGNSYAISIVLAFTAELDLRQGKSEHANQWIKTAEIGKPKAGYSLYIPELTAVKVYLHQRTKASLKKAYQLLHSYCEFFETTHNTRHLIDVLALQAILYDIKGNESASLKVLERSISLARPGGFIRNFIDIGEPLSKLLKKLILKKNEIDYIGQILAAMSTAEIEKVVVSSQKQTRIIHSLNNQPLPEPLSQRELDILENLAMHLSNKEIAQKLFISHQTVKTHTQNIYEKLNVHNRQRAVEIASSLGIINQ